MWLALQLGLTVSYVSIAANNCIWKLFATFFSRRDSFFNDKSANKESVRQHFLLYWMPKWSWLFWNPVCERILLCMETIWTSDWFDIPPTSQFFKGWHFFHQFLFTPRPPLPLHTFVPLPSPLPFILLNRSNLPRMDLLVSFLNQTVSLKHYCLNTHNHVTNGLR